MRYSLEVNGRVREVDVPPGTPLLVVLRDELDLVGTRFGCGQGDCGACYVLADGRAVPSCTMHIEDAADRSIVTVEGLADGDTLHPVQQAFIDEDAMQCGYCTSGILISAAALLARSPTPSGAEIREALQPHLCRCGVYQRVIRAVQKAGSR
jgi:aerobic-type carbon monoxide dehydrogenase small subunit (CoxS/CutS family)